MGIVYVVGIGPGDAKKMTVEAREALERADVICGYTLYQPQPPRNPALAPCSREKRSIPRP